MRTAAREPSARDLTPSHAGPVLADSGPLIALFNGADRWHTPVLAWLQTNPRASLVSTWCVATEVCALLAQRIHSDCALDFLRWVQRGGLWRWTAPSKAAWSTCCASASASPACPSTWPTPPSPRRRRG